MSKNGEGKITALVPVFECAERFSEHLATVRSLQEAGMGLVWVVTSSRDGSDQLARQAHGELGGIFLEVPPGLYQAWNAGIQEVSTEFVYISTVGEKVIPEGLDRLRQALQSRQADVCFTPPFLPTESGHRRQLRRWPVFRFQRELEKRQGEVLPSLLIARLQAVMGIFCVLGSCASCLFRTPYLQAHPFPARYFHYGDAAWVYDNYTTARIVYLHEPVAGFEVHGPGERHVGPRDLERLRRIIWHDLLTMPKGRPAARALSRLSAAARYLDTQRGRRPERLWWTKWKLLWTRLLRTQAELCFALRLRRLEGHPPRT